MRDFNAFLIVENFILLIRKKGFWNDYPCDWKYPYTCEIWLNRKIELKNKGFDVSTISGRAVKYFPTKKNWDTAKSECHALGGYLLTVDSSTVTDWVKQISGVFWIGLNDKVNVPTFDITIFFPHKHRSSNCFPCFCVSVIF